MSTVKTTTGDPAKENAPAVTRLSSTDSSRRVRDLTAALRIDGWLSESEASALYDLAASAKGPIVEIGSYLGRSTACLALGSMAGAGHPVYAIDPFIGPQSGHRPTSLGAGSRVCSPELLRANLDQAGVNGLVKIIPLPSQEAASQVPDCDVLFIDGAHDYQSVCRDIELYAPKLMPGGNLMLHDVTTFDPDVAQAVDDKLMPHLDVWRLRGRVCSAVVFQRSPTVSHRVVLAFPGRTFTWGPISGVLEASLGRHTFKVISGGAHGWDDFNHLWASALNTFEDGEATHFAMLHSDIAPDKGWLDILLSEMDDNNAPLVSALVPIKDSRGLTSTGLGNAKNPWGAHRRLTMREALNLSATFGYRELKEFFSKTGCVPDESYLMFNTGCWAADLRREEFRAVNEDGTLRAWFDFPTRIARNKDGKWANDRESEDWFFSRKVCELGLKALVTRKVQLVHEGEMYYDNSTPHGSYKDGDEQTRANWDPAYEEEN